MQGYFLVVAIAIIAVAVIVRSQQLRKLGIKAILFGALDKKDFIIPPFMLFYLYLIIANVFNLPRVGTILDSGHLFSWVGVVFCVLAVIVFLWGIISFKKSFRVGIDENHPGSLVTTGAFSVSRNPLYVAFFLILTGAFMIFPNWIFFCYIVGGLWLVDRQVNLEENSLRRSYGKEYDDYCEKVRRYV